MPQISLLMANYNNAAYLDQAIGSVVAQTFTDWELIVIDDASSDDSVEKIQHYLQDARVHLTVNNINGGYTNALITGLTAVTSDIVAIFDSDDMLASSALEKVIGIYSARPDVGVVLTQLFYCNADLIPLERSHCKPGDLGAPLVWMRAPTQLRTFRKAAYLKTAGLDPNIRYAEDWDLLFKLEEVTEVLRIDEPLIYYRMLSSSISNAPTTQIIGQRSCVLALYYAYRRRGPEQSLIPLPGMLAGIVAAVRYSLVLKEPAQAVWFALQALRIAPMEGASWRALRAAIRGSLVHVSNSAETVGAILLRSYAVRNLQSNSGNREADRIVCIPLVHRRGHCVYGGDFNIDEAGLYEAVFQLKIEPCAFAVDPLVNLDVFENRLTHRAVAEVEIKLTDLAANTDEFSVQFRATKGQRVEFRAYWFEQCILFASGVTLRLLEKDENHARELSIASPRTIPTVTVVIPCYNGARWLGEAINSIHAQTEPVNEVIVVDDASTDGSAEIAESHGAIVLRNAQNKGEGYSRNIGLKHATGELIAWLDADDIWMPHHVQTLKALLARHPEATCAFAAVQRFGLRDELIRGHVPAGEPSNVFWLALRDWVHTTIGSMTRREALLSIGGFNETERYSVDFDLWLRLSRKHFFVSTHEPTSYWRWHDAQQSANQNAQLAALYRFRVAYFENERSSGDAEFALQIKSQISQIWDEDMAEACRDRDDARIATLNEILPTLVNSGGKTEDRFSH